MGSTRSRRERLGANVRLLRRTDLVGLLAMTVRTIAAYALKEEGVRCQAAGMNDFITKPAGLVELKAVLEKWLPVEAESQV